MYQSKLAKPEVKPHFYWNKIRGYWCVKVNGYKGDLLEHLVMLDTFSNPKANK